MKNAGLGNALLTPGERCFDEPCRDLNNLLRIFCHIQAVCIHHIIAGEICEPGLIAFLMAKARLASTETIFPAITR